MKIYNDLTEDQKQQILNCIGDEYHGIFDNVGYANGFLGEMDDDELTELKDRIEKVIASF